MTLAIDPPIFVNPRPPRRRTPHYKPPVRFEDYRARFTQRVIYPDADPFKDDTYFDKCRLWTGEPRDGQYFINVYSVRVSIYQFAYELEVDLIPGTHVARTICDMTACVNTRHMILRQRRHSAVVPNLDAKAIEDIQWLFLDEHAGISATRLAEIFGVTRQRIYQIVKQTHG